MGKQQQVLVSFCSVAVPVEGPDDFSQRNSAYQTRVRETVQPLGCLWSLVASTWCSSS